ncbi:hypothetical protein MMC22_006961 [Lobaria immixta]|nr:hypothetical protein [Lobaria immixta]
MTTSLQFQIPKQDPKDFCSTPHAQSESCDAGIAKDSRKMDDTTEAGHRLSLSLRRLGQIAKDARTVAPSQEAPLVLEALETIVDLMVDKPGQPNNPNLERKRAKDCDLMINELKQEQEYKRIKGLLATSQSIILNPKTSGHHKTGSGFRVQCLTRAEVFVSPSGTLSIVSSSQNIPNSHSHQDTEAESNCQQTLKKYVGKATFWTNNTALPYKISVTVVQDLTCYGFHSLRPTLSYHAMVQFKSEVITTVKTGNLHILKHLLQQGKASLTDCDPAGRSLLSYATWFRKFDICEYLIKKGADLDSLERSFMTSKLMIVPLAQFYQYWGSLDPSHRHQDCFRLLLLAGTDPLIHDRKNGSSLLATVIKHGTIEELHTMLHSTDLLIDPEESLDNFDKTMLLCLCSTPMHLDSHVENLKFLLNFGVNVNATDKFGNTTLHLCLSHVLKSYHDNWTIVKDFLMLLLQSIMRTGADLHVQNKFGIEASQVAYGHLNSDTWNNRLPKRTQIWNEVLTELGLDIAEFKSCRSACGCQSDHWFERRCDWFKKGAYLKYDTLGPMEAIPSDDDKYEDFSTVANSPSSENHDTQTCFEVIEFGDFDNEDDEDDEDVQVHFETQPQSGKRDSFNSGSSSYSREPEECLPSAPLDSTNERHKFSDAQPEDHHNHTTTISQEPNNPVHPTPITHNKTFWNVI